MSRFIFYMLIIFLAVDLCQIHQIISPIKYLRPGFFAEVILIFYCLFNYGKYKGGKKLLFWRFVFFLVICTGLIVGFSSGKVKAVVIVDLVRYIAGFMGICIIVKTIHDFHGIMKLLGITSLLCSIYVIVHGGFGPGMLKDENDIASFLVMLLPIPYFMSYLSKKKLVTFIYRLLFLINLGAIAATLSRGGMVGTLPTLLFIWMKSKRKLMTLSFFVIAVIGVVLIGPPRLMEEFQSIKDVDQGTAGGRRYFWKVSTDLFLVRPIFGVGANSWGNAVWAGLVPLEKNVGNITPHSMYFQLLSELGILGILAFLFLIITGTQMIIKTFSIVNLKKRAAKNDMEYQTYETYSIYTQALTIGIIGFAICSTFISTLYYPHFYYYLFFIQALKNCVKSESSLLKKDEV